MFGTHPNPSVNCGDIVHLNVGGTRFSTSRQTLTWIPDSFFTALLNGRISSSRDENGAIFIDRDPNLFSKILNYLRTKDIDIQNVNMTALKHEAEFYGITPLLKRLLLCEDVSHSACGNILFSGYLTPGDLPFQTEGKSPSQVVPETHGSVGSTHVRAISCGVNKLILNTKTSEHTNVTNKENTSSVSSSNSGGVQSKSTFDVRSSPRNITGVHVRTSSVDLRHSRNSSFDLSKALFSDTKSLYSQLNGASGCDPMQVKIIKGNFNVIAVAYSHFVTCFKMKSTGWEQGFKSPYIEQTIEGLAVNAESGPSNRPATDILLVGICYTSYVKLWGIASDGNSFEYGTFMLDAIVDSLFFIGNRLVALSCSGKIGVWHGGTRHWQTQDIVPITSYDTAGSFLLLGCNNGSIYYIDMQKFPLRMKDNELLVTELYKDPSNDIVNAISVYLTPKSSCKTSPGICGIWIEIAYGTSSGAVHVIVQHPETVGHGPQLFQTFIVHRSPVTKVCLSEKFLISVCSDYNHVRTWSVTRFRGMISTQPGSMPVASYKILSLEDVRLSWNNNIGNNIGPFGEQDDEQVFIQKVVPRSDQIYIRVASTGKRAGVIKSVDCTGITAFCVHECDGINKMGPLPRRFLFTGHVNGSIQMWDLTSALELYSKGEMADTVSSGGPSVEELFNLLDQCDLSNADSATPSASPSPSASNSSAKVKASNVALLNQISNYGKAEGAEKVINL